MAQVQFPNPGDTNPDTGNTYGEGWTNPGNDITYVYSNGVWSATNGPGGLGGLVNVSGDHMYGDLTIGTQDGTPKVWLSAAGNGTFSGTVNANNITFDVDTPEELDVKARLAAVHATAENFSTLSGLARDSVGLGTFTGTTISDDSSIKTALQELEVAVEDALIAQVPEIRFDDHLLPTITDTFDIGSPGARVRDLYLSDASIKFASGELSILNGRVRFNGVDLATTSDVIVDADDISDITAALGIGENTSNMGTFTPSVLPDDANLKTVLAAFADEYLNNKAELEQLNLDAALALGHLFVGELTVA